MALVAACGSSSNSSSSATTAATGGTATTAAATASTPTTAAAGGSGGTIKLGVLADLSGPCSGTGPPILNGAKIAAQQLNDAGGVDIGGTKYNVQIVSADTQSSNVPAVAAAQKLINSDGVKVLLGPTCGGPLTQGVAPAAVKSNVIYIDNFPVPDLGDPTKAKATAEKYPTVWLDSPRLAAASAGYAEGIPVYYPKAKRVFILDDPGSKAVAPAIKSYLESLGMTVQLEMYPFNTTDFTPYLTKVKAFKPDVLLYGATAVESLAILKQALTLNAAPAYYTVNGSCCDDPIKNATGSAISQPWAGLSFPDSLEYPTSSAVTGLKDALIKMNGKLGPEDSFAVVGYDQANLAVQAMQQGGSTSDVDAINKGFATGKFNLIEGGEGITYDAGHAPSKSSQDICSVTNGKATCQNVPYPPANFKGDELTG